MEKREGVRFYISANSGNGFYSLYDRIFQNEDFEKIFVIHGGPGTGKSTLMRRIAERLIKEEGECEEILCSSDPDSLDGVIIRKGDRKIGIIDGTAPHPRVITAPGAKEELWNIGELWNSTALSTAYPLIKEHTRKKREAYRCAYALLRAASSYHKEILERLRTETDQEKLSHHILRALGREHSEGVERAILFRSYSMRGEVIERSVFKRAGRIVALCGERHAAELYLTNMERFLGEMGKAYTVFRSPLCSDEIDGILLEGSGDMLLWEGYVPNTAERKNMHLKRFFLPVFEEDRRTRRMLARLEDAAIDAALFMLKEAGHAHLALEEIYKHAMSYEALRKRTDAWAKEATKALEV